MAKKSANYNFPKLKKLPTNFYIFFLRIPCSVTPYAKKTFHSVNSSRRYFTLPRVIMFFPTAWRLDPKTPKCPSASPNCQNSGAAGGHNAHPRAVAHWAIRSQLTVHSCRLFWLADIWHLSHWGWTRAAKEDEGRTLWLDTQSHASSNASSADDDYSWQWPTSFWSQFKVSILLCLSSGTHCPLIVDNNCMCS